MAGANAKDVRREIKNLVDKGWHVEHGGKHYKCISPWGDRLTVAVSPGCPFAIKNIQADIRRIEKRHNTTQLKQVA